MFSHAVLLCVVFCSVELCFPVTPLRCDELYCVVLCCVMLCSLRACYVLGIMSQLWHFVLSCVTMLIVNTI